MRWAHGAGGWNLDHRAYPMRGNPAPFMQTLHPTRGATSTRPIHNTSSIVSTIYSILPPLAHAPGLGSAPGDLQGRGVAREGEMHLQIEGRPSERSAPIHALGPNTHADKRGKRTCKRPHVPPRAHLAVCRPCSPGPRGSAAAAWAAPARRHASGSPPGGGRPRGGNSP